MRRATIRMLVALLLTVVFLFGSVMPTLAVRPQTSTTVEITSIDGTPPTARIHYQISWTDDRGKATHFGIRISRYPTSAPELRQTFYTTEIEILTGYTSPVVFFTVHSYILPTYSYDVEVRLLVQKKNGTFRELRGSDSIDEGYAFPS